MSSRTTSGLTNRSKYESMDLSGSVFLISGDGKIISLPMPSRSPRDPLNWSVTKRVLAFLAVCWFSVVSLVLVQGSGFLFVGITADFSTQDMSPFGADILVAAPSVFMGIGTFIWVPLSIAIGRRPAFLLAALILTLATVWAGVTTIFYHYIITLCLSGFAEGFTLSVVIDLTFIHQRPHAIAASWSFTAAAAYAIFTLAPQMSSNGSDRRLFYRILTIPCLISIIFAYFFYPETYFIRPAQAFDGRILAQSATEKTQFYDSWEEYPSGKELPDRPNTRRWWFTHYEYKTFVKTRVGWRGMFACYPQIALCVFNPLIFWVALLQAIMLCSTLSIGEIFMITLSSAPYNFSITSISLTYLAPAAASLLAWPASGYLLSAATRKLAMNNNGIREAEYYLPAFILPVISGTLSNILFGLAVQRLWHPGIIIFASSLSAFAFAAIGNAGTLWVTEAFPRWAAPGIVVVYGLAYLASGFMTYAILPWIRSQGIQGMQFEIGLALLVVGCVAIPLAFFGKKVRQRINGRWAESEAGALRPQSSDEEKAKRGKLEERKRNGDVELNILEEYER